jgi:polysaccharide biosynthesis/export protein
MSHFCKLPSAVFAAVAVVAIAGCASFFPGSGPSRGQIKQQPGTPVAPAIQVIDVDDAVTHRLMAQRGQRLFSETLGNSRPESVVGAGDVLEVWIWEAAPAMLFSESPPAGLMSSSSTAQSGGLASVGAPPSHGTALPEQVVDDGGFIVVPFAGRVPVAGQTLVEIQTDIARRLAPKANQPEVLVRLSHSYYGSATVVGEVTTSTRVQLIPGNERLLDALAAASGVRTPVNKTVIQVTRAGHAFALPLDVIIHDPRQNVPLQPGDVVTAMYQPFTFTALGATTKPGELPIEAQGTSLAQALARAGGVIDERANAKGIFLFRFESAAAMDASHQAAETTPDGRVPVVYRVDLTDPRSFFLIQSFPINDKDVLYVSNAPTVELQKFLTILVQAAYPINTAIVAF